MRKKKKSSWESKKGLKDKYVLLVVALVLGSASVLAYSIFKPIWSGKQSGRASAMADALTGKKKKVRQFNLGGHSFNVQDMSYDEIREEANRLDREMIGRLRSKREERFAEQDPGEHEEIRRQDIARINQEYETIKESKLLSKQMKKQYREYRDRVESDAF